MCVCVCSCSLLWSALSASLSFIFSLFNRKKQIAQFSSVRFSVCGLLSLLGVKSVLHSFLSHFPPPSWLFWSRRSSSRKDVLFAGQSRSQGKSGTKSKLCCFLAAVAAKAVVALLGVPDGKTDTFQIPTNTHARTHTEQLKGD